MDAESLVAYMAAFAFRDELCQRYGRIQRFNLLLVRRLRELAPREASASGNVTARHRLEGVGRNGRSRILHTRPFMVFNSFQIKYRKLITAKSQTSENRKYGSERIARRPPTRPTVHTRLLWSHCHFGGVTGAPFSVHWRRTMRSRRMSDSQPALIHALTHTRAQWPVAALSLCDPPSCSPAKVFGTRRTLRSGASLGSVPARRYRSPA